ncbi:MAG: HD domain-containing protein [Coriobacteriia bacterium]|nr:HD domain-containing protein [Coriobacteriia bacterium]
MSALSPRIIRMIRVLAWLTAGLLAGWRIAVLVFDWSPRVQIILGDVVSYVMPLGVTLVLLGIVAMKTLGTGREHRFWGLLWLAVAPVFVAEVYWTYYALTVDLAGPIQSQFVRALHIVGQAAMLALLVRMTRFGQLPPLVRVRFHLDILSALAVAWPVVYLVWTLPAFDGLPGGGSGMAGIAAVYPLFGLLMVAATVPILFSARTSRPRWERIVAGSLVVYGVSLILNPYFNLLALQGLDEGFALLSAVSGLALLILDVGVIYRLTSPEGGGLATAPWALPETTGNALLRYFPVVVAAMLVPLGALAVAFAGTPAGAPLFYANLVVAWLLALRSLIAAIERARARAADAVDAETGAFDARLLIPRLAELVERASEAGRSFCVVVFAVNDPIGATYDPGEGRAAGRELVGVVRSEAQGAVEIFRLGEDRIAVVLDGATPGDAATLALRAWVAVDRLLALDGARLGMTVSAGVACFPLHALSADKLLAAAEVAVAVARGSESEPVAVYDASAEVLPADERRLRERMRVLRSTVRALAEAVDARDPATRDHSVNVAELATALAQVLGLPDSQVQIVGLGALMHDVGKIGVRDEILLKPGPLDSLERAEIEEHPVLGERILAPALLDDILPIVRWHHERWDGEGYPDRLSGERIPVESRALAICDAFETLTSGRPYREAVSTEAALAEIEACAGSQFDPAMTAVFARLVRGLSGPRAATTSP